MSSFTVFKKSLKELIMLKELIKKNRSYRRFHEDHHINTDTLENLVELARCSASAGNMQPLKFLLSNQSGKNADIFSCLAWAGYLKDWPGPVEGERPSAYIVILGDTEISNNFWCDHGIAAQSIMLGAVERGFGGCIVASINRERLKKILSLPDKYEILLVLAIGEPKEEVVLEEISPGGDIKYWREESGLHHVPKRRLEDIILEV